jgi:RNA polymerase sigma factor for flagellar operon FliA
MTPQAQTFSSGPDYAIPDHELALWRACRNGSSDARTALFNLYAAFAQQIAGRKFRNRTGHDLDLQDLRQLAYAGLLESIDRFDPDRGIPFRGFAARRIAGSIVDGVSGASELRQQFAFRSRFRAERARSLGDQAGRELPSSDAMRELAEIATGLAIGFMLETGLASATDTPDRAPSAYESLAWKEAVQRLSVAVEALAERERDIIRWHYIDGVAFELIAELLSLSKGRISQLHKAAIGRLRTSLATPPDFILKR